MDEPKVGMAWNASPQEWSRPPEPVPAASGMLVPLFRAATVYKLDWARINGPRHAIGLGPWIPQHIEKVKKCCPDTPVPSLPSSYKLNLSTGRSGMILDLVTEQETRPTATACCRCWRATSASGPSAAASGGRWRLRHSQQPGHSEGVGVCDMAFHKKAGLRIGDMVRSKWVYRTLRNFRVGIEAGISCLKRAYGLARCTWRGPRLKAT